MESREYPDSLNEPAQFVVRGPGVASIKCRAISRSMPGRVFYTEFAIAIDARRSGTRVPDGLLAYPTVVRTAASNSWRPHLNHIAPVGRGPIVPWTYEAQVPSRWRSGCLVQPSWPNAFP